MKNQSRLDGGVVLLGTTTLERMISAAYDENDPLHSRWIFSECGGARCDVEDGSRSGDEVVYVYYHPEVDKTIMTNIRGDTGGFMGSSAGFKGKVLLQKQTPESKQKKQSCAQSL